MNNNNRGHERRQSPRRSADFRTTLVCNNLPVLHCKARDIGFGGIFVTTPGTPPPAGSAVSMIIDVPGRNPLSLKGVIQHSKHQGAGIAFYGLNSQAYTSLVDVVYAKPSFGTGHQPAAFRVANG